MYIKKQEFRIIVKFETNKCYRKRYNGINRKLTIENSFEDTLLANLNSIRICTFSCQGQKDKKQILLCVGKCIVLIYFLSHWKQSKFKCCLI
jgi:hypothetical protein